MSVISINKDNFNTEVSNSDKTVLLDFYAEWCVPCQRIAPLVSEIANERTDIKVGAINVDEQPELCAQFGVTSVPHLAVVRNGKIVNSSVGARPKEDILGLL